jgi:hypothetical protein
MNAGHGIPKNTGPTIVHFELVLKGHVPKDMTRLIPLPSLDVPEVQASRGRVEVST